MPILTQLSGNEIYCLAQKGYKAKEFIIGNNIHSLGFHKTIHSEIKGLLGVELRQITQLLKEGRKVAYNRMLENAEIHQGSGIVGVNSKLIFHAGNVEFLSSGSLVEKEGSKEKLQFSTYADGREFYSQLDAIQTHLFCFR